MSNFSGQLLCTFSSVNCYEEDISSLIKTYKIIGERIYILCNTDNEKEIFLTFNGKKIGNEYFNRTISVHRKKDYNVLYSINALNELVKIENLGNFNSEFIVPWELYKNSLITIKDGKLKITRTKLVKIFWI